MSSPFDSTLPSKDAHEVDFPVERVESEHVSRREFAKFLCLVSGGLAVGSGWVAVKDNLFPPHHFEGARRVCRASEVGLGETHAFTLPGSAIPYILIHLPGGDWSAFEQKCTHLSCAVYFQPTSGRIECPCHHGAFDARTGAVLQGPPPRALPGLVVSVQDGDVFVSERRSRGEQERG
jgi:nitrite reductase/ring-hydroxylating ferredoxin subunit